jgi:ribosome maturation factor RimP
VTPDRDVLARLVRPVVEAHGLDLEELSVTRAGRRSRVVVAVDKDGGVTLDECADVATRLSSVLDDAPGLGEAPYVLEVGSPGVERPLRFPRHWRRNVGRLVRAVTPEGREVVGRVSAADEEGADLDVGGSAQRLAYAEVASARVQVEFGRPSTSDTGEEG